MLLMALIASFAVAPATPASARGASAAETPARQDPPRFRASVQMVRVAAVVRDRRGRLMRGLTAADVEVLDRGSSRPIEEFRVDTQGAVSLALLFDESGSMAVSARARAAREAAAHLISALDPARDEVAIFTFDSGLREIEPFTSDLAAAQRRLGEARSFGLTALFDAVAETARRLAPRPGRRAVVVLTDGVDTSSRLRPEQVSAAASAIDVPVYVLAVVSPLDHPGTDTAVDPSIHREGATGDLANMARWTGGHVFVSSAPAHASVAAREIVGELRHQYLIAFEARPEPGWHPIEVRVRERGARVRARSGYLVGSSPTSS
jgi:Ca-activated chloride channel homolog